MGGIAPPLPPLALLTTPSACSSSLVASKALFSQIELSFSATNLRDRDVLSKSDPMLIVYTKGRDGLLTEACRTEVLNSLNPTWIEKYIVVFQFEVVQILVFRMYDVDTQFRKDMKLLKLEEQQFLGEASCALSEIATKPTRSLTLDLLSREDTNRPAHPGQCGQLLVRADECISSKTTIKR